WLGPEMEGIDADWLGTWAGTLKLLTVHFWYDDCLGSPQVLEVTTLVLKTCLALEAICITGIDWPRAKAAILQALRMLLQPTSAGLGRMGTRQRRSTLQRLSLEGSQAWHEDELAMIKGMIPRVEVTVVADRTR
ncbi:unnamed protein product, partial [Symbiodinium pilosum]